MLPVLFLILLCLTTPLQAQVYKCQTPEAPPRYQDKPCSLDQNQQEIQIQPQDDKKIAAARQKLNQELKQQQIRQEKQKHEQLENRKINALEAQVHQTRAIRETLQEQTSTQSSNTTSTNNAILYPYYAPVRPPRPLPGQRLPIKKQIEINKKFSADPMNPPLNHDTRLNP